MTKEKLGFVLITLITIAAVTTILFLDPIAQDTRYHNFHDTRMLFSIPNFWNVISNLPFVFAGVWGLGWIATAKKESYLSELKFAYFIFFAGTALVGLGSSYYHLQPNNFTLVWDRLPMTLAFMALFSIIVAEFISISVGRRLLIPMLVVGITSVFYWYYSELSGNGDLRLYILVQFLPMLVIPIILILFNSRFTLKRSYWLLIFTYLTAKVLEHFDAQVMSVLPLLSGHTLKHIVAAFGVSLLVYNYRKRVRI